MRTWPSAGWALLLALAVLLVGCRRDGPPAVEVERLLVSEAEVAAHPSLGLGADQLRGRLEAALARSDRFRLHLARDPEPDVRTVALRLLGAGVLPAPGGGFRAVVEVELAVSPGRRLEAGGRGEAPFPAGDLDLRGAAFQSALGQALDDAVAGLVALGDAEAAPDEQLVGDLGSPDAVRREVALRLLVERKSRAAVDPLLARLSAEDPEVVLRAAGALAAIGDPRAAPALVEAASRRDPAFVVRIATALGDLGGPEAEAYLFTAAGGHPDPEVRAAAEDALATLRANRRRSAAADRPGRP